MTREEAIKRLREYSQYAYGVYHNEQKDEEAFNMAIEALQYLQEWGDVLQGKPVKHGKWINKRLTKDSIKDIKDGTYGELIGYHDVCSICGFDLDKYWHGGRAQYCPECGAKMDKE